MPVLGRHSLVTLLVLCLTASGLLTSAATPAPAAAQATVQGRVVDSDGDPLASFEVVAYARRSNGTWRSVGRDRTAADGTFSVSSRAQAPQQVRIIVYPRIEAQYLEPWSDGLPWPDFHAPQWIGGAVDWNTPIGWRDYTRTLTDDRVDGTTYVLGSGGTSVSGVEVTMTDPAGVIGVDPRSEAGDRQVVEVRYRTHPSADEQTLRLATSHWDWVIPEAFPPGTHELSYRVAGTTSAWRTAVVTVTAGERAIAELVTPNEIGMLNRPVGLAREAGAVGDEWPKWTLAWGARASVGDAADWSWQWYRGDTPIPGATREWLTTPPSEGHGSIRLRTTVSKPGYAAVSWFSVEEPAEFPVISIRASRERVMVHRGDSVVVRGRVRMSDGSALADYTRNRTLRWRQYCPDPWEGELGSPECSSGTAKVAADGTYRFRLPRHLRARQGLYAVLRAARGDTASRAAPLTVTRYQPRIRITAQRHTARVGERVRFRIRVSAPEGVLRKRMPVVYFEQPGRRPTFGVGGRDGQVVALRMPRTGKVRVRGYVAGVCPGYDCFKTEDYLEATSNIVVVRVRR